jgi:hypothetical protein
MAEVVACAERAAQVAATVRAAGAREGQESPDALQPALTESPGWPAPT